MADKLVVLHPLMWEAPNSENNRCWTAKTPFGTYSISNEAPGYYASRDEVPRDFYFEWASQDIANERLEAAKIACEADYQKRAFAPFIGVPSTPVTYQYRYQYEDGVWGGWHNERRSDADELIANTVLLAEQKRALYAAPFVNAPANERLKRAWFIAHDALASISGEMPPKQFPKTSYDIAKDALRESAMILNGCDTTVAESSEQDLHYLLECVKTHADKFPAPEHMRALVERVGKAYANTKA